MTSFAQPFLVKAGEFLLNPDFSCFSWVNKGKSDEQNELMKEEMRQFFGQIGLLLVNHNREKNEFGNDGGGNYDSDEDDEHDFVMNFTFKEVNFVKIHINLRETGGYGNYYDNAFTWNHHTHKHFKNFFKNFQFELVTFEAFLYVMNDFFQHTFGPLWYEYDMCYEGYDEILHDVESDDSEDDGSEPEMDEQEDDDEEGGIESKREELQET
jgi:hypothetical protein